MLMYGSWLASLLAERGDLNDASIYSAAMLDNAIATRNPMQATLACDSLAVVLTRTDYTDVAGVLFGALTEWRTPPGRWLNRHLDAVETLQAAWILNNSDGTQLRAKA